MCPKWWVYLHACRKEYCAYAGQHSKIVSPKSILFASKRNRLISIIALSVLTSTEIISRFLRTNEHF
jgi:hypothetical protein